MKIYIVTDGEYSDYGIVRVFLNRDNADEYIRKFRRCADVEEWDVSDATDDYELRVFKRAYIDYMEPQNGVANVYFRIETENSIDRDDSSDHTIFYNENVRGRFIMFRRIVPNNADYDKLKARLTKACQDMLGHVKYLRDVEGMSVDDVNVVLNKMMESEEGVNG